MLAFKICFKLLKLYVCACLSCIGGYFSRPEEGVKFPKVVTGDCKLPSVPHDTHILLKNSK